MVLNVTIKIEDELCKKARHEAVDSGLSLSGWVAELIRQKVASQQSSKKRKSLIDALGNEDLAEYDFVVERDQSPMREVDFS